MTNTKTMNLLEQPFKMGKTRDIKNKVSNEMLSKVSTSRILWHLANRHKFGLVSAWALVVTIMWVFPPAFDMLRSLI